MAVDTQAKRRSIVNLGCPWRGVLPIPDGTIGQGDRQTLLGLYSGILWQSISIAPSEAVIAVASVTGSRLDGANVTGDRLDGARTGGNRLDGVSVTGGRG